MNRYTIDQAAVNQWPKIAELIAHSIPNALISKLGAKFGGMYYRKFTEQDCSCCYVASDESKNILGVIIGTTDFPRVHSIAFKGQLVKLLIAANLKLLSWSVISWVARGLWHKLKDRKQKHNDHDPIAELTAIAICPQMRGTGLAWELIKVMEKFMNSKELSGPYIILTEKNNTRANSFYKKTGAILIESNLHHGREINKWYKEITVRK
ncbi:MAG: GNAT family N-acetyltransferase [Planctomycetes bacterium]|nr:GNAT family N-acetyltransferase [Planctomycetota bacterium]